MNSDRYHTSYNWTKMGNYFESDNLQKGKEEAKQAHASYQDFLKMSPEEQQQVKREATRKQLMDQYNHTKEILDRSDRVLKDKSSSSLSLNLARGQNARAKNTMSNLRISFRNENLPFPGASNEFIAVGPEGDKHIIPRDYLK